MEINVLVVSAALWDSVRASKNNYQEDVFRGGVFCEPAWDKLRPCAGGIVAPLLGDSQDDAPPDDVTLPIIGLYRQFEQVGGGSPGF